MVGYNICIYIYIYNICVQARVVSVQARVVRRGRVFREYGLLPGRLPGARGYLGGEDFVRLEDLKAN